MSEFEQVTEKQLDTIYKKEPNIFKVRTHWSEYSAQFDNGKYPISETEFTSVLSMILLKITDLITIIPKLKRKK